MELKVIEGTFVLVGAPHPTPSGGFAVNLRTPDNRYVTVFQNVVPTCAALIGELTILSETDVEVSVPVKVKDPETGEMKATGETKKEMRKNIVCTVSRLDKKIESITL